MPSIASDPRSGDDVREALARIWELPEFTPRQPGLAEQALGRVRDALRAGWEWIAARLPDLDRFGGTVGTLIELTLYALLAGVLLGMGWLLARSLVRRRDAFARPYAPDTAGADRGMEPATWEARAREAAEAGHFREAALARYRALLLRLARGELLRLGSGRTPGDYLAQLRGGAPEVAAAFQGFVALLHPLAFGAQAPSQAGWDALVVAAARVEGCLPQATGGGR